MYQAVIEAVAANGATAVVTFTEYGNQEEVLCSEIVPDFVSFFAYSLALSLCLLHSLCGVLRLFGLWFAVLTSHLSLPAAPCICYCVEVVTVLLYVLFLYCMWMVIFPTYNHVVLVVKLFYLVYGDGPFWIFRCRSLLSVSTYLCRGCHYLL